MLGDLFFPYRDRIDAHMQELAKRRPARHSPQAFVCGTVWGGDHGVTGSRGSRIDVASRLPRPGSGGKAASPPFLFIGVAGREEGAATFAGLHGHAQPIAAMNCPVPVESDAQRQAFGALRKTLAIVRREFDHVRFSLEKPLVEIDTQYGPCLPDFIIRAHPVAWEGRDSVDFMIEVMEAGDPAAWRRREDTHQGMRTLGTMCIMEADWFDRPAGLDTPRGLAAAGINVTDKVRAVLRRRLPRGPAGPSDP